MEHFIVWTTMEWDTCTWTSSEDHQRITRESPTSLLREKKYVWQLVIFPNGISSLVRPRCLSFSLPGRSYIHTVMQQTPQSECFLPYQQKWVFFVQLSSVFFCRLYGLRVGDYVLRERKTASEYDSILAVSFIFLSQLLPVIITFVNREISTPTYLCIVHLWLPVREEIRR